MSMNVTKPLLRVTCVKGNWWQAEYCSQQKSLTHFAYMYNAYIEGWAYFIGWYSWVSRFFLLASNCLRHLWYRGNHRGPCLVCTSKRPALQTLGYQNTQPPCWIYTSTRIIWLPRHPCVCLSNAPTAYSIKRTMDNIMCKPSDPWKTQ